MHQQDNGYIVEITNATTIQDFSMNNLDFTDLPDLSYTTAWITLDEEIEESLLQFKETYDRANASLKFAWFMCSDTKTLCCNEADAIKAREAFLRASLAEFSSMEEELKRDLMKINKNLSPLKINQTKNPLLHIIKEFRNLEIHLQSSNLSSKKRNVMWGDINNPSEARELVHETYMVSELSIGTFNTLHNSKHYHEDDKIKLVNWFNESQKEWGFIDLVIRSVNIYSRLIMQNYINQINNK